MIRLLFLDTETTGLTDDDRLCQLAYKCDDIVVNELFNPGREIGYGAMAVHHITNEQVREKELFQESAHYEFLKNLLDDENVILVAHNAPFDIKMIEREGLKVKKYIDTLKIARYLLKDDPAIDRYSLQHLRYYFKIQDEAVAHDAWGDIVILEEIFDRLYTKAILDASARGKEKGIVFTQNELIGRLLELSMGAFTLVRTITFGKHEGMSLVELINKEPQYVSWLVNKCEVNDRTKDTIESLKYLLSKHDRKV